MTHNDLAPVVTPQSLDAVDARVKALTRPHPRLLTQYLITLLLMFPVAPFAFLPFFFRYQTLRYRFDDDGVHASWGILFRREVSLTYARIQDIHLRRGLLERWLGLGSVQIQTASGAGSAELVIEGVTEFAEVRDFLYAKMRGATSKPKSQDADTVALLLEIRDDLRAVRTHLVKNIEVPRA